MSQLDACGINKFSPVWLGWHSNVFGNCFTASISILLLTLQQSLSNKPEAVSSCTCEPQNLRPLKALPLGIIPQRCQFPTVSDVLNYDLYFLSSGGPPHCFNASSLHCSQEGIPRQRFIAIVGFISCFSFLSKIYSLESPSVQCLITAASHCSSFMLFMIDRLAQQSKADVLYLEYNPIPLPPNFPHPIAKWLSLNY